MFQGEIPKGFIQTGKDGFRNQAGYESALGSLGATGNQPATSEQGSGFWLFALIVLILSAVFSLFTGSEPAAKATGSDARPQGDVPQGQ